MERLLVWLARAAGRRRWRFVIVWAALLVLALPFAGQVAGALSNGGFNVPGSQSMRLIEARNDAGLGAQPFTLLVVSDDPGATRARFAQVFARVRASYPQLRFRTAPVRARGGRVETVTGFSGLSQNEALKLAQRLLDEFEVAHGPVRTYVLGQGAVYATFQHVTQRDLQSAETIGLPIVLVILLALFGAAVAAALPLVLGIVSVLITLAIVRILAGQVEISVYAESMVSMIGLGVAVDYSLFVLARFREELAAGVSREAAVVQAMRTSGRAVVFSGLTVLVSLGTVWIVPVRAVQSMAAASMLVVAVAVLAAATLLPALLHLLGPNVDRWRVPFVGTGNPAGGSFWHRVTGAVMRQAGRRRSSRPRPCCWSWRRRSSTCAPPTPRSPSCRAARPWCRARTCCSATSPGPDRASSARSGWSRRLARASPRARSGRRSRRSPRGSGATPTSSGGRSPCSRSATASRSSRRSASTPRACRP